MGLPSTPYFLYLHYFGPTVNHSHFFTSYIAHEFAIPLFLGFFKLVCFLKAHLSISWTCDPLFLPLELNGFFYPFTNSFLPVLLSFFLFGFPKMTVNNHQYVWWNFFYLLEMLTWNFFKIQVKRIIIIIILMVTFVSLSNMPVVHCVRHISNFR